MTSCVVLREPWTFLRNLDITEMHGITTQKTTVRRLSTPNFMTVENISISLFFVTDKQQTYFER